MANNSLQTKKPAIATKSDAYFTAKELYYLAKNLRAAYPTLIPSTLQSYAWNLYEYMYDVKRDTSCMQTDAYEKYYDGLIDNMQVDTEDDSL